MGVKLAISLLCLIQCNWTNCATSSVSGEISYFTLNYEMFPPSKRATTNVFVSFHKSNNFLGITTTRYHANIDKQCHQCHASNSRKGNRSDLAFSMNPSLCIPTGWFIVISKIVKPVVGLAIILILVMIFVKYKRERELKSRKKLDDEPILFFRKKKVIPCLPRKRELDAFVLYHFDSDDDFIINDVLPELEESRDFKLCLHSRDFTPGNDIKDNIKEAIDDSNSAISVMSQGFVDSMWCKEEFTHCYIENMKDPEFNLFVILMQPANTLENISPYIQTFFDTKTYLEVNDPKLFPKLAIHLENARKQENDGFGQNDFELGWPAYNQILNNRT